MDRLGPDNFSTLQMKGHVLHRARAHLKVPGWLLVWNALLTKKLPMFLSRLNEISGGCEKILPVSGLFWSNLKFFRMMDFTAWLCGWNVRVSGILLLFSFWDVCSADCRWICWARWWPAWAKEEGYGHVCLSHISSDFKENPESSLWKPQFTSISVTERNSV